MVASQPKRPFWVTLLSHLLLLFGVFALAGSLLGMTALEFGRPNLFEPLGIKEVIWPADPQGVTDGGSNIIVHPRDAAKIGYLFLNKG